MEIVTPIDAWNEAAQHLRSGDVARARDLIKHMLKSDRAVMMRKIEKIEAANANRSDKE